MESRFHSTVMPALVAGIHVFLLRLGMKGVDGRDIGERSDAVLRTAMPGHDTSKGHIHTCSNGTAMLGLVSSHSGTGRFFERMKSGLNSFD